jgi:alpha-beta hydrolase superfamily lysophospholipase
MTEDSQTKVQVQTVQTRFTAKNDLKLFAVHDLLDNARGRVVILHGFAEHLERYDKLVGELTNTGFTCHRFDLRGHGRSEGRRGHVSRFSDYRNDLDLFLKDALQLCSSGSAANDSPAVPNHGIPLFLLAHSLGALIALSYVLDRPEVFAALALSSPFLAPAFKLPPLAKKIGTVAGYVMPTLALKSAIAPDSLTHDPTIVEAYRNDPLIFSTVTTGWWYAARQAQQEVAARAREITTPALFLLGDADRLADWRHARAVFELLGTVKKHLEIYPGFFHEVLNELGREQAIRAILSWFASNLDSRSAAAC